MTTAQFKEWLLGYKGSKEQKKHHFIDVLIKEFNKIKFFEVMSWEGFHDEKHFEFIRSKPNPTLRDSRICFHGNFYLLNVDDGLDLQSYYLTIDMDSLSLNFICAWDSSTPHGLGGNPYGNTKVRLADDIQTIFDTLSAKRFPTKTMAKKFGI